MFDITIAEEMELNDFLKLPRLAQLLFFQRINFDYLGGKEDWFEPFYVIGFNTDGCKSPIEQILLFAFNLRLYDTKCPYDISLEPQKEITINKKKYYADFCFDAQENIPGCKSTLKLVIECDGHDYHHASKQQVSKDYERENDLKINGYDVIRFTGSQIYKDPYGCADTILEYISSKTNKGRDFKCRKR